LDELVQEVPLRPEPDRRCLGSNLRGRQSRPAGQEPAVWRIHTDPDAWIALDPLEGDSDVKARSATTPSAIGTAYALPECRLQACEGHAGRRRTRKRQPLRGLRGQIRDPFSSGETPLPLQYAQLVLARRIPPAAPVVCSRTVSAIGHASTRVDTNQRNSDSHNIDYGI
jgi:hypothetical protein